MKSLKILEIRAKNKIEITFYFYTLFEIFIFVPKIQLWFPEKIVEFLGVENSWNCCGFGLFICWQLWFHKKIVKKYLGDKLVKMLGFCQNWISGQKIDFSNSVIYYILAFIILFLGFFLMTWSWTNWTTVPAQPQLRVTPHPPCP